MYLLRFNTMKFLFIKMSIYLFLGILFTFVLYNVVAKNSTFYWNQIDVITKQMSCKFHEYFIEFTILTDNNFIAKKPFYNFFIIIPRLCGWKDWNIQRCVYMSRISFFICGDIMFQPTKLIRANSLSSLEVNEFIF